MRHDDRLARMGETFEDYKTRKDSNAKLVFESRFVRKLLNRLGIDKLDLQLRKPDIYDAAIEEYMTLVWFKDTYPDCPVHFVCEPTWYAHTTEFFDPSKIKKVIVPKLLECFGNIDKARIGHFALVCNMLDLNNALVMNHDHYSAHGACLSSPVGDALKSITSSESIHLMTLDTFAAGLKRWWTP
jgi:hypothetical protein